MKKMNNWVSFVLVISLFCTFLSVTSSYADGIQMDLSDEKQTMTKYDIVLDEYFAEREGLYMLSKKEFDSARWEFIQDWKAMLGGITFRDAEVEYSITEVMSETTSETKLRIYEYISLVYVCNGYDVERNMKFGLDHIIRLTRDEEGYRIVSDSYVEPVGYKFGYPDDLAVFEEERTNLISLQGESDTMEIMTATTGNYTINQNYNPSAAISYSYLWNGESVGVSGYNPAFYYYNGVDCCNFVSQCIYAGGMTMDSTWRTTLANASTPIADNPNNPVYSSVAWVNTASFMNYWVNTKGYYFTQVTSVSQAIPGNTFFWLSSDAGETYNHNMLIVDVDENGNVLVNMHTGNQEEYAWSLNTLNDAGTGVRKFYTIDFVHNFGDYTPLGLSGHTKSCSLCGTSISGSHDTLGEMVVTSTGHSSKCSICDYVWPSSAHNANGKISVSAGFHATTCSDCDYVWPDTEVAHNTTGEKIITSTTHARTCSICGHVWPSYSHNQNGEIIQGTTIHTYTCSVCDYGWKTEGHNRDTVNYVPGESQHTCTCSVCEKTWNETHTFVKGLCSVCRMREVIIASID